MSEPTTTSRVRAAYVGWPGWDRADSLGGLFDRWLAETVRAAKASGFDEGHRIGWEHCQDGNYGTDYWDDDTPNPYDTPNRQGVSSVDQ